MKNLIIMILAVAAVYKGYGYFNKAEPLASMTDADVMLFTSEVCHQPCIDARAVLRETSVSVEEVLVSDSNLGSWERLKKVKRSAVAPLLITKTGRVEGFNRVEYLSAIGDSEGVDVLPWDAKEVLASHFDNGYPKLVMYGTQWCPYCQKAKRYFAENNILYEERDVEASNDYRIKYTWLQSSGYPLFYYGAKRLKGFDEKAVARLVK